MSHMPVNVCACFFYILAAHTLHDVNRRWQTVILSVVASIFTLLHLIFTGSLWDFSPLILSNFFLNTCMDASMACYFTGAHIGVFIVKCTKLELILLPLTTKMAEVDRLSTSVSITQTYFPPWFSWMLRIMRSPDILWKTCVIFKK